MGVQIRIQRYGTLVNQSRSVSLLVYQPHDPTNPTTSRGPRRDLLWPFVRYYQAKGAPLCRDIKEKRGYGLNTIQVPLIFSFQKLQPHARAKGSWYPFCQLGTKVPNRLLPESYPHRKHPPPGLRFNPTIYLSSLELRRKESRGRDRVAQHTHLATRTSSRLPEPSRANPEDL